MPVKRPHQLSRDALLAIVAGVQERMYLDLDAEGREFWNPAKEWSGADICMEIQSLLHQHGLVPGDDENYSPRQTAANDVDGRVPQTADAPENTLAALVAEAMAQGLSCEDLDNAVHDAVGGLATNVNNAGLEAQIEFLVLRLGAAETRRLLEACSADKP
jgi:hypothetical protein